MCRPRCAHRLSALLKLNPMAPINSGTWPLHKHPAVMAGRPMRIYQLAFLDFWICNSRSWEPGEFKSQKLLGLPFLHRIQGFRFHTTSFVLCYITVHYVVSYFMMLCSSLYGIWVCYTQDGGGRWTKLLLRKPACETRVALAALKGASQVHQEVPGPPTYVE